MEYEHFIHNSTRSSQRFLRFLSQLRAPHSGSSAIPVALYVKHSIRLNLTAGISQVPRVSGYIHPRTYIFTRTHTHRHPSLRVHKALGFSHLRASNENCERAAHVPNDTRLHNHAVTSKSRVRCIRYAHSCSSRLMQPSQNLLG